MLLPRVRRAVLASFASVGLALPSLAQRYDVPGDFPSIQEALDAVPNDAVIVVHGGEWGSVTITRPVTLVGDPAPNLGTPFQDSRAVILAGSGSGAVTLCAIRTGGLFPDSILSSRPPPSIEGGGFDELHVVDSEILAPMRTFPTGLGYGGSAIDVDVPLVVLERSTLRGSGVLIDDACTGAPPSWYPPAAVEAAGTVVALDSNLRGGDDSSFQFAGWPTPADCDPGSCPYLPGGSAVECATLFHSGSVLEGGRGARWTTCQPGPFCCESPPGVPIVASQVIALSGDLVGTSSAFLGGELTLTLATPGPSIQLRASEGMGTPTATPSGWRFLEPATTQNLGTVASPGIATIPVPSDPALLGRRFVFQGLDPATGWTRPSEHVFTLEPRRLAPRGDPTTVVEHDG